MQQRQLRLGDILDDYCPRERRVTNHAIVAMVGHDVKQTRCTTCDAEHEYKHAKVPRQRRKNDAPAALYAQVAAGAPKKVSHEPSRADNDAAVPADQGEVETLPAPAAEAIVQAESAAPLETAPAGDEDDVAAEAVPGEDEGPIHRRLIRASLPRPEGQQPPARPIPEFTIRQPGGSGRHNRFRPRNRGGQGHQGQGQGQGYQFQGNRSNGNMRGQRPFSGRPPSNSAGKRHGPHGRKRSK